MTADWAALLWPTLAIALMFGVDAVWRKTEALQGEARAARHRPQAHPADVRLFEELRNLLPSTGCIRFIDSYDFSLPFDSGVIQPLQDFWLDWNNAERQFIDPDLESMRVTLRESVGGFLDAVGEYTVATPGGRQSVRAGSEHGGYSASAEARYRREAEAMGQKADVVVQAHQALYRCAREKLVSD